MQSKKFDIKISHIIINVTVFFYLYHDFIFNYALENSTLRYAAAWKDAIVVVAFIFIALKLHQNILTNKTTKKEHKLIIYTGGAMLATTIIGMEGLAIYGYSNFRFYYISLFFIFLLALYLNNNPRRIKTLINSIVLWTIPILIFAFYQYAQHKEPSDFWYWEIFNKLGHEQGEWDTFRNGKPRISSFYTSSLDLALYILAFSLLLLSLIKSSNTMSARFFYSTLLITSIILISISTVRSAQIGLIASALIIFAYWAIKNTTGRIIASLTSFVLITLLTFYYIQSGYTDDPSALGRSQQWMDFFSIISKSPFTGIGAGYIGPNGIYWFDSFWINLSLSLGLVLALPLAAMVLSSILATARTLNHQPIQLIYFSHILISTPIFAYLFVFQSFSRTPALLLIFLPIFIRLIQPKTKQQAYYSQ